MRVITDDTKGECIYCGADSVRQTAPDVYDDVKWAEREQEHRPGCEWVQSRAYMFRLQALSDDEEEE